MEIPALPRRKISMCLTIISGCVSCTPVCSVFAVDHLHVAAVERRVEVMVLDIEADAGVAIRCPRSDAGAGSTDIPSGT